MEKIDFGQGKLFALKIDTDGLAISDTKAMSSYVVATRVVTVTALDGAKFAVNDRCIINEPGENNFAGGLVTSLTTIEIQEEANDIWIETFASGNIDVYAGMEIAVFEAFEVAIEATGQAYKGNDRFNKEWYYTDVEATATATNILFDPYAIAFFGGYASKEYFGGMGLEISDRNNLTDKDIKPADVKILAIKRRNEDDDKFEEILIERANTGDFELPTSRDAFFTNTFTFRAQQKSISNPDVLTYTVEK